MDTEYPATVTTVTRTISKLPMTTVADPLDSCQMCKGKKLNTDMSWRKMHTMTALEFLQDEHKGGITDTLCFACHNLILDANGEALLCIKKQKPHQFIFPVLNE